MATMMANQVYGLALDYLSKAEEDAAEGDVTGSTPVKASLKFTTTWPAGAEAPLVNTKVSYTRSVIFPLLVDFAIAGN